MMANWDKLNTEFYNVLNTFSDEDWNNWESNRASKKEMRRLEMLLKAKQQEEKIKLSQIVSQAIETIPDIFITSDITNSTSSVINTQSDVCGECNYALAA